MRRIFPRNCHNCAPSSIAPQMCTAATYNAHESALNLSVPSNASHFAILCPRFDGVTTKFVRLTFSMLSAPLKFNHWALSKQTLGGQMSGGEGKGCRWPGIRFQSPLDGYRRKIDRISFHAHRFGDKKTILLILVACLGLIEIPARLVDSTRFRSRVPSRRGPTGDSAC